MDPIGTVADHSRATWCKSSYSGGNCVEVMGASIWRKSSFSNGSRGDCVEVGAAERAIVVRDSKNPDGPSMMVSQDAWANFTNRVGADPLVAVRRGA